MDGELQVFIDGGVKSAKKSRPAELSERKLFPSLWLVLGLSGENGVIFEIHPPPHPGIFTPEIAHPGSSTCIMSFSSLDVSDRLKLIVVSEVRGTTLAKLIATCKA